MNKRILALSATMLWSLMVCIGLWAEEVPTSGECGANISWTLSADRSTLTLTGSGPMNDYDTAGNAAPWSGDDIKTLVVGEGITTIGDCAFITTRCLTSITIANSVTSIGKMAFHASTFPTITLPSSLTTIGSEAFCNSLLERIDLPATVSQVADDAFSTCPNVEAITVAEGNTHYTSRDNTGKECNAIIDLQTNTLVKGCKATGLTLNGQARTNTIPEGVTAIGDHAFEGCKTDLYRVVLPNSVQDIGTQAFFGCNVLNDVELGAGVQTIGAEAFAGTNLTLVTSHAVTPPTTTGSLFQKMPNELWIPSKSIAAYKASSAWNEVPIIRTIDARLYAIYDATNKVLTFCYDKSTDAYGTDKPTVYEFADGYKSNRILGIKGEVVKVVLDESFGLTYRPEACTEWFYGFKSLKTIEHLDRLDTRKVTDMLSMFRDCTSLESLDLSKLNTAMVENMSYMFSGCNALKSITFGTGFTTAKVDNMAHMFDDSKALKALDLSGFDTQKVTSMTCMFTNCPATIYVSDMFKTDKVPAKVKMFTAEGDDKAKANYIDGYFLKKVGTLGGQPLGAKGAALNITELDLSSDADYVLTETNPVTASTATYTRTMTSKWGTLCLPYDFTVTDNSANFYTVATVGTDLITLNPLTGTVQAGTPVIFYANGNEVTFTAKNVALTQTAGTGNQLVGTFATQEMPSNAYFIAKDAFHLASAYSTGSYKGVKTKGFRAYLQPSTPQGSLLRIATGGTTGIDSSVMDDLNNSSAEYYNIDGTRTSGLHRGLNIVKVGGKTRKVMVK